MLLERIARKRTVADGYRANDRLKTGFKALALLYGLNGFFIAMSFIYTTISAPPSDSVVGRLILAFQATDAVGTLLLLGAAALFYVAFALSLKIFASIDSLVGSLIASVISLLIHGLSLAVLVLVSVSYATSLPTMKADPTLSLFPLSGLTALAVIAALDLVIWIVLHFAVAKRSYAALAAALRRVPGRYEYSYGTVATSSTERTGEVGFIENALQLGVSRRSDDDTQGAPEDSELYLVRFLHRGGKIVAASLQDRSTRRLMAIFPGRDSKRLNVSILLEDSYAIQRELGREAQATLSSDSTILELASESGWTVSSDGESLIHLRKS